MVESGTSALGQSRPFRNAGASRNAGSSAAATTTEAAERRSPSRRKEHCRRRWGQADGSMVAVGWAWGRNRRVMDGGQVNRSE